MARNYFKVIRPRTHDTRCHDTCQSEREWLDEVASRTQRILSWPPRAPDYGQFIFFDDADPTEVGRAWMAALARAGGERNKVHIYKKIEAHGPWSEVLQLGEWYPVEGKAA